MSYFTMAGVQPESVSDGIAWSSTKEDLVVAANAPIVGDVVRLVTGGPLMTVVDVCECGSVNTAWFVHDGECWSDLQEGSFPNEALELVDVD
jgi:uncharacterized protein YodC (DUF2158 family)